MASTAILFIVTAALFAPAICHGGRKGGYMRCGLPPYADSDKLKDEIKIELKNIWREYVEGTDCSDRKQQTEALLELVPQDIRESLRPNKRSPPCGIPRFLEKLPTEMQPMVQAIWKDYIEGNDCKQEQKDTRDLLKTLTKEQRKALRPAGGWRGGNRGGPGA